MARKLERLTVDALAELPVGVRTCLAWELDPVSRARAEAAGEAASEKEAWVSRVLLEWGSCGRVLRVDDAVVGLVVYAPPVFLPGTASLPTAPVGEDAVQLATAWVAPRHRGAGYGRLLVQGMAKDLLTRGDLRAVEAIGVERRRRGGRAGRTPGCVLPADFLRQVGFRTQRAHPAYPRMRLDLRSVLTWRAELEQALERLLGAVRPVRAPRPAPQGRVGERRDAIRPAAPLPPAPHGGR